MKQCNYCSAKCYPYGELLTSEKLCNNFKPIQRKIKFSDAVSNVTITNSSTAFNTLKLFAKYS